MSKEPNHLFHEISNLSTEQRNSKSKDIDFASTAEILKIINNEDKTIPFAVEKELPYIEKAVDNFVEDNDANTSSATIHITYICSEIQIRKKLL